MDKRKIPPEIAALTKEYEAAYQRLTSIIQTQAAKGNVTQYRNALRASISEELTQLNIFSAQWANNMIPQAYGAGIMQAYNALRAQGIDAAAVKASQKVIQNLVNNATGMLYDANNFVGRHLEDTIRQAGVEAITQKVMTGSTVKEAKRILLEKLQAAGVDKIADVNGRLIPIESYASTVARTTTREATNRGSIQESEEEGGDLVQITQHFSTCPLCAQFEGRVFSISGNDKRYPPLSDAFPSGYMTIHPNCTHSAISYQEDFDKDAEATRKLSNRPYDGLDKKQQASVEDYQKKQAKNNARAALRREWKAAKLAAPEQTPNTLSAYGAMKRANSPKFQAIKSAIPAAPAKIPTPITKRSLPAVPEAKATAPLASKLEVAKNRPNDEFFKIPEFSYTRQDSYKKMRADQETQKEILTKLEATKPAQFKPRDQWTDDEELKNYAANLKPMTPEYKAWGAERIAAMDKLDYLQGRMEHRAELTFIDRGGADMEAIKKAPATKYTGFTTKTTGMSGYDDYLDPIERAKIEDKKGLSGVIAEMSPEEYIDRCAKQIFGSTWENQVSAVDRTQIEALMEKMAAGTEMKMPVLNYATLDQEGRHRAFAAMNLGIKKIPVLVIDKKPEIDRIIAPAAKKTGKPIAETGKFIPNTGITPERIAEIFPDKDELNNLMRAPGAGDHVAGALNKEMGTDGLPGIISKAEATAKKKQGYTEVFRGVNGKPEEMAKHIEDFKRGEFFPGFGVYGNGTYTSNYETTAFSYANQKKDGVMQILINPNAKIGKEPLLETAAYKQNETIMMKLRDTTLDPAERKRLEIQKFVTQDTGRYALTQGYDAYIVDHGSGELYYVVLNRTALEVVE